MPMQKHRTVNAPPREGVPDLRVLAVPTLSDEFRAGLAGVELLRPGPQKHHWSDRQMAYMIYLRCTGQSVANIAIALNVKYWRVEGFIHALRTDPKYFLLSEVVRKMPATAPGQKDLWVCRYCKSSFIYAKTAVEHMWQHAFNRREYQLTDRNYMAENRGTNQ